LGKCCGFKSSRVALIVGRPYFEPIVGRVQSRGQLVADKEEEADQSEGFAHFRPQGKINGRSFKVDVDEQYDGDAGGRDEQSDANDSSEDADIYRAGWSALFILGLLCRPAQMRGVKKYEDERNRTGHSCSATSNVVSKLNKDQVMHGKLPLAHY